VIDISHLFPVIYIELMPPILLQETKSAKSIFFGVDRRLGQVLAMESPACSNHARWIKAGELYEPDQ
jgi:hypothetical protein